MNYRCKSAGSALAALLAVALPRLAGQTAPAQNSPTVGDDETIVLSPFMISASEGTEGYSATTTLAGSRVRTDLRDIGSSISVVTSKFLQDTGATDNQSLLQYTTNTEVGGLAGNFSNLGNSSSMNETARLLRPNNATRVRGLDAADNTRNYFLTDIPWDSFNIDRVELQRGPNSILFGVGSPAGIINTALSSASFRDSTNLEVRFDNYGSLRGSVNENKVLLPDELAIRVSGLADNKQYEQAQAFENSRRAYAALRYDPKFLRGDGMRTTLQINGEYGKISADRPRTLPPIDTISAWYTDLNKATYDPFHENLTGGLNNSSTLDPHFAEAFVGRQFASNAVAYYDAANSSTPSKYLETTWSNAQQFGLNSAGAIDNSISGALFYRPIALNSYSKYAARAGLPGAQYGLWKDKSMTDTSVFDFYHNLIDGGNSWQHENWHTFNADLTQSFFNNRLAFDLTYDHQDYKNAQEQFLDSQQYTIGVDLNQTLSDGSPNPNVGRPYVASNGQYGNNSTHRQRDDIRFTVTGEVRADDFLGKSLLTDILGRHQFTGILDHNDFKDKTAAWSRYALAGDWASTLNTTPSINQTNNQVDWVVYLGPSLLNTTSAAGANLPAVSGLVNPSGSVDIRYFDSHWNRSTNPSDPNYVDPAAPYSYPGSTTTTTTSTQSENPANYVGWTTRSFNINNADQGDIAQLYRQAQETRNVIDSQGITWQGFFLDGTIIPTIGYRRDTVRVYSGSAPLYPNTDVANPDATESTFVAKAHGTTRTYDVVLHTPKAWRQKLPGELDVSLFYNRSQNFKADTVRKDVFGNNLDNPKGKTNEYGFSVSALDDRVVFKTTFYKTTVSNATLEGDNAGLGSNLYWLWATQAWGAATSAINLNGLAGNGSGNAWAWDYASNDLGASVQPQGGARVPASAAIDAAEIAASKAFIDGIADQGFFDNYGVPVNVAALKAGNWAAAFPTLDLSTAGNGGALQPAYGGTIRGIAPVATVDTESKGVEFELTAKITPTWDVSINAAKTTATRQNLSQTIVDYIEDMHSWLQGPAGDLRVWGAGDSYDTMRRAFDTNIYGPYRALVAQAGTQAPEIRPWRVNAITNYGFNHGALNGFNVGGGVRWEQGSILGYGLTADENIDVNKVYKGEAETYFDFWVGYTRKLTRKMDWRIQLNLRDVGKKASLLPISVEPNGDVAAYRIREGMTWQVTNSLSF
ncbi:MAG TPA: TonB-dependent receptor plug domain-containing protein [Opitutaceae bacterium]|nr:TonB-dependent receptor plug domain-containing protein [Opitutaceae bacterium]